MKRERNGGEEEREEFQLRKFPVLHYIRTYIYLYHDEFK